MTSMHDGWDADFGARAADSAECLLVVGGYSENQRDLARVVAAARDRILMSPSLGDFFELRLVDMGPKPTPPVDDAAGVARLVFELTSRPGEVARNFSALVVIDQSARAVDRVLHECRLNSVLSELNVRFRGIARNDDRSRTTDGQAQGTGPRTVISSDGERQSSDDLDKEIARYAEDLLADFGSGGEQGLSASQLDELGVEAESRLRSVVETDMAATIERRKAELREEAARQEAALRREAERRREADRKETERRELKRDIKRREAEPRVARQAEAPAEEETRSSAELSDNPQARAAKGTQSAPRGPARPLVERVKTLGRSAPKDADRPDADADTLLLDCKARIQAGDEKGLRAHLSKLRAYADDKVSAEERAHLGGIVREDRLLRPGMRLGTMDVQFYDVMLRLAYGLPLSYADYCDVEDRLSVTGEPVQPPHRPLLEAMSGGGTADIRVAAITRYLLGEERLTSWFRAGRVDVGQMISAVDAKWDRPHHAGVMYTVTRMYLSGSWGRYDRQKVAAGLRAHGYLAAALLEQYPESEQHQIAVLIDFLRAAYPDGVDRQAVEDIATVSAPTRAVPRAVLPLLRHKADLEWAADVFLERRWPESVDQGF
jgi:hypothetical protein